MENLVRRPTESSPEIFFNAKEHVLEIRGSSYLEDTLEFYEPLMSWVDSYLSGLTRSDRVRLEVELVYFNSSSSRVLLDFFELFNKKAFREKIAVDVHWFYESEDEDMREFGQEFQDDFKALAFQFFETSRRVDKGV